MYKEMRRPPPGCFDCAVAYQLAWNTIEDIELFVSLLAKFEIAPA